MFYDEHIPTPFLFNPLKHHAGFIRDYIITHTMDGIKIDKSIVIRDLKHIGVSLMDIYFGPLSLRSVTNGIIEFLITNNLISEAHFSQWAGKSRESYKTIILSDGSEWVLKYFNNRQRYIHPFPARLSPHSLRAKANTLKSAVLYLIFVDKDFISRTDLNSAREIAGLSPIKDVSESEAITAMIEVLRHNI